MPLILPNDIANGQLADGERLQQNNDAVESWANQEAITRDGATAMTAPLSLVAGPPTAPNQAASKEYVDTVIAAEGANYGPEAAKPVSSATPLRYFATDTRRDWLYDGTGWIVMGEPMQNYTPTLGNVTLGTGGSTTGNYHRCDGWCDFTMDFSLGAGGALTGQPSMTVPIAAAPVQRYQFAVLLSDVSANDLPRTPRRTHRRCHRPHAPLHLQLRRTRSGQQRQCHDSVHLDSGGQPSHLRALPHEQPVHLMHVEMDV